MKSLNRVKLCGAKTRKGHQCKKNVLVGKQRCRLHGGLSTGPRTEEGKARIVAAHYKHGRRSKAYLETRKRIWAALRKKVTEMKIQGYL